MSDAFHDELRAQLAHEEQDAAEIRRELAARIALPPRETMLRHALARLDERVAVLHRVLRLYESHLAGS